MLKIMDKLDECYIIQKEILSAIIIILIIAFLNGGFMPGAKISNVSLVYCCLLVLTSNYLYKKSPNAYTLTASIIFNVCILRQPLKIHF